MRPPRRHNRETGGQAVMEMALVLPICIILVMNFIAIMLVVRLKAELSAATSLAAQSAISAPVSDTTDACAYALDAFYTTLFSTPGAYSAAGKCPPYKTARPSITGSEPPPPNRGFKAVPVTMTCTTDPVFNYFDGANWPPPAVPGRGTVGPAVTCSSAVSMDFGTTPLGFAVFWNPTLTVTSVVFPSTARQKCWNAGCTP